MPGLAGVDPQFEAQPAIGVGGRVVAVPRADMHGADEILVAIGRAQLLVLIRPVGGDAAAADDAVQLHLEHIGEVGADGDLQVEPHRPAAMVGDVEVLVHAAAEFAADDQTQGARLHRAILAEEGSVGEVDAGGVGGDGAAVQQVPRLAVGRDRHGGDHAGVEEIQALVRRPIHLAVRIGDQHGLRVVDGDLRRADFDLERHGWILAAAHPDNAGNHRRPAG